MRLDRDPSNGDVLDTVTRERLEQLAGMERVAVAHWSAGVRRLTAARPARSSDATVFQFNASSSRSDMGRRRASITASGTASGSRTATGSPDSTGRGGSADDPTRGAYRAPTTARRRPRPSYPSSRSKWRLASRKREDRRPVRERVTHDRVDQLSPRRTLRRRHGASVVSVGRDATEHHTDVVEII